MPRKQKDWGWIGDFYNGSKHKSEGKGFLKRMYRREQRREAKVEIDKALRGEE